MRDRESRHDDDPIRRRLLTNCSMVLQPPNDPLKCLQVPRVIDTSYHQYMGSSAWCQKRKERLLLDDFRCTRCGEQERLEVHHLDYSRLGDESMDDLLTLCHWCHMREHGRDPDLPPAFNANELRQRNIERDTFEREQEEVFVAACIASGMTEAQAEAIQEARIRRSLGLA